MYEFINKYIKDKNVLILGLGKEGKSTYNILKQLNTYKSIGIADKNNIDNIYKVDNYHIGDNYLDSINDYDIVFKSPGISIEYNKYNTNFTCQTELFLEQYNKQIIGITATKGKSTTTSLIYHVLNTYKDNVLLCGNIGVPCFDIIKDINKDTIIVFELACHQLEKVLYSPHISVLLNIYKDHLDHYKDYNAYINTKLNIYKYQNNNDYLFITDDLNYDISDCKSNITIIDATNDNCIKKIKDSLNQTKLIGQHNLKNATVAYYVCKLFNISINEYSNALETYIALEHRIQYIGNYNNIDYYDDSISTTSESTIKAIQGITNLETVLIGGLDRGIDYSNLIDCLLNSNLKNIILMYQSGERIYKEINNTNKNIVYVNDLKEACTLAINITNKGSACLLSPAAASYDSFKNYIEKGLTYQKYIKGSVKD